MLVAFSTAYCGFGFVEDWSMCALSSVSPAPVFSGLASAAGIAREAAAGRIVRRAALVALRRLREPDQLRVDRRVGLELELDVHAAPTVRGRGAWCRCRRCPSSRRIGPWTSRRPRSRPVPAPACASAGAARATVAGVAHARSALAPYAPAPGRASGPPAPRSAAAHSPPRCPRSAASRGSSRGRIRGRLHRERPSPAPRPEPHLLRGARPGAAPPAEPNPRREGAATRDFRCVRGARRPLRLRTGCPAWPGRRRR